MNQQALTETAPLTIFFFELLIKIENKIFTNIVGRKIYDFF